MRSIALCTMLCLSSAGLMAHEEQRAEKVSITSLNQPDPVFVPSGDQVSVNVRARSANTLRKLVVTLDGRNVTHSFSLVDSHSMTATIAGLRPGMNTFEVFMNKGDKRPAASLKVAAALSPAAACSAASFPVNALSGMNVAIVSATPVAATATVPEHCLVNGTIDAGRVGYPSSPTAPVSVYTYAIKWQVRLPSAWSGRFVTRGGGGLDGSIPNTTGGLANGFAVAANDSGHDNNINTDPLAAGAGSFGTDFQARVDFAYSAIDRTTEVAKALIKAYYDKPQEYSYFEGCSMGGREAMMVTQKLPKAFDGVVVGDPAFRFSGVLAKSVYISQIFGRLAASRGIYSANALPLASNAYTNQDLQLVSNAILEACDAMDGLEDGMVSNPMQCTSRKVVPHLSALRCTGTKTATCLDADQIETLQMYYSGPITPKGERPYDGWMWDPGIAGCTSETDCNAPGATNISTGWRTWNLGTYQANPATAINTANAFSGNRGGAAATVVVPTPPVVPSPIAAEGTTRILMEYDLDAFVASTRSTTAEFPVSGQDLYDVASTDLSDFASRGGKVLIYQPQTGGPFSPLAMVHWYEALNRQAGGSRADYRRTHSYARLFLMPGAQHCGGGPSTSDIDPLPAVVNWTENGVAPDSLLGTAASNTPWPGRTRPLCPYPAYAHYKGGGDINDAENFECRADPPLDRGGRGHGREH
jgi:feruloyl esterase